MADSTKPAISSRRRCNSSSSSLKWTKSSSLFAIAPSLRRGLSEPAGDVIFRLLARRALKNNLGLVEFNQFAEQEEACELGYAGGLLHVVRDDHLRALILQGEQQVLDFGGRDRIERRAGFVQ